jgi:hypothetical protein
MSLLDKYMNSGVGNFGNNNFNSNNNKSVFSDLNNKNYSLTNVRGVNQNNFSPLDKMRGILGAKADIDNSISLTETYLDKRVDTKVMGGKYNQTIVDIYNDDKLFKANFGLFTDGFVKENENYFIENENYTNTSKNLNDTDNSIKRNNSNNYNEQDYTIHNNIKNNFNENKIQNFEKKSENETISSLINNSYNSYFSSNINKEE